jgi:hypothetical protein
MRPDRIIIGECRAAEALDMLQAMNTGHEGSMTTVHANNTRDAVARLEVMVAMAGYDIPAKAMRSQIASALQIVIQARRLTGGRRKVVSVSEISGMEGENLQMHDLFTFEQAGRRHRRARDRAVRLHRHPPAVRRADRAPRHPPAGRPVHAAVDRDVSGEGRVGGGESGGGRAALVPRPAPTASSPPVPTPRPPTHDSQPPTPPPPWTSNPSSSPS